MKIVNIAHGMDGARIPKMTERQLITAFFMADANLPAVLDAHRAPIIANMNRIADAIGELLKDAKGVRKTRLTVHYAAMTAVLKLYKK